MTLEQLATRDKRVYLDNSATTPVDADVLSAMTPFFGQIFGNANSLHDYGRQANKAVAHARQQVATALNAKPSEIFFTSCGTEANNWVLRGVAQAKNSKGNHIITTSIEHPSVLNTAKYLASCGYRVTYLSVDKYGKVNLDELEQAICPDTILISIMYANNEVGTIQPIKQIAEIAHRHNVLLHSDCVQAVGSIPVDVRELDVDFATISAHKFYGPKGVGALFIRNGVKIDRLIIGGEQERNQRGGTTNTPAIVGMGVAIEKAQRNLIQNSNNISNVRNHFIDRVMAEIPYVTLNGHPTDRLPGNANFSFEFIEGEGILMLLDFAKIAVSSGSACSSQSLLPSHVLLAMGVDIVLAHGSIRFSFGKYNTLAEADYTVDVLKESIAKLRLMSPLFVLKEGEIKNV
ncbi:MAG: cysteine desulfurase NifS [Clostridia bacterium]|nr:cysteine desulfurase NifS [Clostridia bacterium]